MRLRNGANIATIARIIFLKYSLHISSKSSAAVIAFYLGSCRLAGKEEIGNFIFGRLHRFICEDEVRDIKLVLIDYSVYRAEEVCSGICEYVIGIIHDKDIWYYVGEKNFEGKRLKNSERFSSFLVDAKRYDDEDILREELESLPKTLTYKILELQRCPSVRKSLRNIRLSRAWIMKQKSVQSVELLKQSKRIKKPPGSRVASFLLRFRLEFWNFDLFFFVGFLIDIREIPVGKFRAFDSI